MTELKEHKPRYKQKVSSFKVVFYDMEDNEIEIDEFFMSQAYTEIDQAIYEYETNNE